MSATKLARLRQNDAAIGAAAIRAATSGYPRPVVAVMNQSTVITDAAVQAMTAALQIQVTRDFAPLWFTGANLVFVPKGATPPAGAMRIVMLDTTDQAGALGYHDLGPDGEPQGLVFAKTTQQFGLSPTVTASHELLEMLADPAIDRLFGVLTYQGVQACVACEVGDPVEADALGYVINGVRVSDFVTPAYFHPGAAGPYSFGRHVSFPMVLAPGGYQSYLPITTGGWKQVTAEAAPGMSMAPGNPRTEPQRGSRREKRIRGHEHWARSTR